MVKQSTDILAGSTKTQGCADQASRYTPLSDSQLIVRIAQRDEQALGMLYDHYGTLVYTIALRVTHDLALAETLVQDVFRAVWQSASSFQIGASVPAWLLGMARQQAIELTLAQSAETRPYRVGDPEQHTLRAYKHGHGTTDPHQMHALLNALPADQRETLELAYYYGLTCREIAARLREPVGTIKTRLHKGLRTLAEALSDHAANLGERMNSAG